MTQQFLTWRGVHRAKTALLVVLSLAGLTAACGESSVQSMTPTGPSPLAAPSQLEAATGVPSGNERIGILHTFDGAVEDDEDSDVDSDEDSDVDSDEDSDDHGEVEIEGIVRTAITACPSGSFTLRIGTRDVMVKTSAFTVFHPGVCDNLRAVGTRVEVKGRRALDGSIDASRIELEDADDDAQAEIEGVVRTATTGCPTGSFVLRFGTRDVVVRTSSLTAFRHGTCNDLRAIGMQIEVNGRRALDGSIDATRIEFEDSDDEDSDD